MGRLFLKETSTPAAKLMELERIMDEMGIKIKSHGRLFVEFTKGSETGKEFEVGRDSDQFPRYVDEHFYLME